MKDRNNNPKRKPNHKAVERELWMLSGNECAHENCGERMVTETGAYVGEIAHIRGVKPTSARHDATMDDDELRDKSNLILLCHKHHIETDDESRYPVEEMQRMKERHESRFKRAYIEFEAQFADYTDDLHAIHCSTLNRWRTVLGLTGQDFDEEYFTDEIAKLNALADQLSSLTEEARLIISFVVERGAEDSHKCTFSFPLDEMARRTKRGRSKIKEICLELERLDFGGIDFDPDFGSTPPEVLVYAPTEDQRYHNPHLGEIRAYCEQTGHRVDDVIVRLRFDLLDN